MIKDKEFDLALVVEGIASIMVSAKIAATNAAIERIEQTPPWQETSDAHKVYWEVLTNGIDKCFLQCLEHCKHSSDDYLVELYIQYIDALITKWELMSAFVTAKMEK